MADRDRPWMTEENKRIASLLREADRKYEARQKIAKANQEEIAKAAAEARAKMRRG